MSPTVSGSLLSAALLVAAVSGQERDAAWRADVAALTRAIESRHPRPFHTVARDMLRAAAAELAERVPALADHEVVAELARLVARVGDGHTSLGLLQKATGFRRLSVTLRRFADGVFVTEVTDADTAWAVGGRVVAVGRTPVGAALQRVGGYVAADNRFARREHAARLLSCAELLHACRVVEELGRARFVIEKDSERRTLVAVPAAVRLRTPRPFSCEVDRDAVFVTLDRIGDAEGETLRSFFRRVVRTFHAKHATRLVIDLRRNGGGRGHLIRPLIPLLIREPAIDRYGGLFVLTSPRTFSAAQNFVNELQKYTDVVFAGEPTGSRPNHFGDPVAVRLPNSGIVVRISSLRHQDMRPRDRRVATVPDLPVATTAADFFTGKDPVRTAAIEFDVDSDLGQIAVTALARGRARAAARVRRFLARAGVHSPAERLRARAMRELQRMRLEEAERLLELTLELYPGSAAARSALEFVRRL